MCTTSRVLKSISLSVLSFELVSTLVGLSASLLMPCEEKKETKKKKKKKMYKRKNEKGNKRGGEDTWTTANASHNCCMGIDRMHQAAVPVVENLRTKINYHE